ncbi:MAG: GNAT family N-acetyltransferase [Acidobacteriota bacterium]
MPDDVSNLRIVDNKDANRWEAHVGNDLAVANYRRGEGRITFTHTEVPAQFEGQGVAGKLVKAALDQAKDEGLEVIPRCSFVKGYIERHAEYQPLVANE